MRSLLTVLFVGWTVVEAAAQHGYFDGADSTVIDLELAAEDTPEPDPDWDDSAPPTAIWTTSFKHVLERKAGFLATDSTRFAGPPVAVRSRLRAKLGDRAVVVLVADQDAGEALGASGRTIDFTAASVSLSDIGPIRSLVAGSIRPKFGLGLALWSGQRMTRLASGASSLLHPTGRISASGSSYEAESIQGLGLDLNIVPDLRVLGFAGRTRRDANIRDSGVVISMATTGLHRNKRELDSDDRLAGKLAGGAILLDSRRLSAGIFLAMGSTELAVPVGGRPFQRYRFSGRHWRSGSLFASTSFGGRLRIAAEHAWDSDGSESTLLVVRVRTARGFDIFGAWRNYPQSYSNPYGILPGASSSGIGNEIGWSVGLKVSSGPRQIAVYRDVYRKPWLQADSFRPSALASWGISTRAEVFGMKLTARYDSRLANREIPSAPSAAPPFSHHQRLRFKLSIEEIRTLEPGFDAAFVRHHDSELETGAALGQRLVWRPTRLIILTAGIVFFDSDSGNSGVYLYEPDLPDYLSVPLLSGPGQRAYLILNMQPARWAALWVKYAATQYERERTIGAGVDRLTTRTLRTVSFALQVRI